MGDTRRVVDGEDRSTLRPLRPAAPLDGALAESGAAPDPAPRPVPRPRRPWLRSETPDAPESAGPAAAATSDLTAGADRTEPVGAAEPSGAASEARPTSTADATSTADTPGTSDTTSTAETTTAVDATTASDSAGTSDTTPVSAEGTTSVGTSDAAVGAATVDGTAATGPGRRHRTPFAHALRLRPRQAAATAARATRAWSRRPSGRLTLPGVFLLILVFAMAAAGAVLVPAAVRAPRPVAVDEGETAGLPPEIRPSAVPTGPSGSPSGLPGAGLPTYPYPTGSVPPGGPVSGVVGGRPADALAGWAQQVGAKVGIPPVAVQAYGYAELVLAQTNRSCALSWTTLAAIGSVESNHGRANGAQLGQDGRATPEIIGLPLDGRDGRMRIIDTDRGVLDKDTTYDRAIGPMQFIPTTWAEVGVDADNDGVKDPHDLDDAALAAGNYLCRNGRNLSIAEDWWNAILSYNDVRRYAQDVFDTANRYGQASRT
ncbi:lytic transglycosylase domain-containing protein [Micromonospora sp. NPDC049366]|uniref:lytic transglycosylase domain-containing protein n=1 Tax=Micromonospora sp. NPDC049366 TaxID=3364271 RepID=UPI00379A9E5D